MKKIYTILLMLGFGIYTANAQCSGCTTNITGLSASSYVVSSGQKLCISPTGTITGLIAVSGGTLCNQGKIQTSKVSIMSGGKFDNSGTATIDSLLITGNNSALINSGTMTHVRMTTADHASTTNNGTVTISYIGDTIGTYINNGSLTINMDVYHGYNSQFTNNGYMYIFNNFYNSTGSTFATSCMIGVDHDWYNAATVTGYGSSCGGFNIAGASYNSGTVTTSGGAFDICDAGNPPFHVDGNSGTITSGVTYCSCMHACITTTTLSGVQELASREMMRLYPNPAGSVIHLQYSNTPDVIEVYNATGSLVLSQNNNAAGETAIHTETLAKGVYLLTAKYKGLVVYSTKFIKE
ncbi:MAG: T9SS type A sorting domain-containing protein [Bacteroidetes bacterium]|nr:T9SS type A sorting domain-containing protein [Bacteroidota bacterium]